VDLTLSILQKALEAINNWQDYHKEHQLYSRRFESIISLQTRLFDHVIHFKLYKLLRLLDIDDKLIGDYLDYKITKEELFASAKATKHSPLFFAANLISEPEVKSILISLCNIESMNQRELISHLDHFIEEQQQDTFIKAIHQN
jgi:hypothetical protein